MISSGEKTSRAYNTFKMQKKENMSQAERPVMLGPGSIPEETRQGSPVDNRPSTD